MKKFIGAITAAVLLGVVSPIYETAITERVKLNSEFFGDDLVNLKLYGGDKDDTLRDIEKTSDGGYVGVGYTKSNAFGDIPPHIGDVDTAYGHITKFDANMNRQWTTVFDEVPQSTTFYAVTEMDGKFMAVGYLNDAVQGNSNDALTVIFASDGSYISHSVYGGVGRDEYRDIVKAPDGTLVAVGQVQSLMSDGFGTTYGDTDALISKFHATSGAPLWHKSYGGAGKDFLDGVTVDSTGKIFVSGHTYSSNSGVFSTPIAGKNDAVIMSLDSDGSLNWVENFAGANAEHFYKLSTTTDGNIIGVGYTGSTSINGEVIPQNGDFDAFAAKVNANTGETIWLKNWGGSQREGLYGVTTLSDARLAVVGYTASPVSGDITKSYGGKDALRIIIDTDTGEGLVDVFGEYADETAYGIVQDSDDRMIIVGDTHSSFSAYGETNSGGIDMFSLIRTFAPVITLPDETVIRYQGEDLDLLAGVTASDYEDGDISSNIQVTGAPIDTSTVGEYTITYTVTDSDNNATSVEAALFIYIPQPPVLTVPGTTIIQPGESFDPRIDTTAMDPDGDAGGPLDISTDITFTGAPVDTNISGTYLITYRVEDAQGNVVTQKRTLIIEEKPEIIFEDGIVIELNDTAFNAFDGVVGMDAEDGSVEVTVIYNDVDVTTAGQYEIVYSATDSKNNTTIKKRTVFVSSAPIITHPGKTIVYLGESFDPRLGVTAIDAEDGDLTEQVLIGGDIVDTNSAGDYVVTYSVSDIAGSEAFETRINVVTSRPIITGTDDLAINPGSVFDPLSGVEATDAEDGDITDRIEILSNNLNVDIPGTYTIIYYVEDKNGGNYTASRIITVTEKPVIVGADDKTVNPDGSFDPMNGITATDNEDDNSTLNVTITGGSGVGQDWRTPGTYTLEYSVTDSNGNTTTVTRTITVTEPPVIIGVDDKRVNPDGLFDPMDGVSATDKEDDNATLEVTITGGTGVDQDWTTPGTYTLIYSVTDSNSNVTVVIRTITVTNAPTIFGADNKSINPGSSFNPLEGISASDKEDGANLSVEIISNTVNTTTPGTYEVVYKTVDSDGNATIATRVIVVTNAPTINTPGNESVNIGEVFDPLSGVTALDEEDGSIATIIVDGSVDTSKSGDYVLTYTVVDSDGNETSVTRIITVMSKPTILLPGDNTINKNSSFDPLQGVSATDKEDGNLTSKIEVIENNVNTSRAGEYTVAYRVVDSHGNVFEIIRTVTVVIPNYWISPYILLLIATTLWCGIMSVFCRKQKTK